jgi:GT2 family glycosyltransferase
VLRSATSTSVIPDRMYDNMVSILLVCYNAKHFLPDCLNSIRDRVTVPYEVILLDNASVDGTADVVRTEFSWVRLLRSEENLGFTKGNNFAARYARGKYYLLLNPDTVLLSDIAPAIRLLESDRRVGIVGAEMYGANHERRSSTGHFPRAMLLWKFGWLWSDPRKRPYGEPSLKAFQVDWVEGSFLLTTADNWRALGGLDESNFFYGDDVEFCRSTADHRLTTVHCTDIKYVHFGGYEASRLAYIYAGFRRYHRKFSSYPEQLLADAILRLGLFVRIGVFGVRYLVTRDKSVGEKFRRCIQVHKSWKQTNSVAPRFS